MGVLAAGAAMVVVCAGSAMAVELYRSDTFDARLDTTISSGLALRAEKRDDALIFKGNDPKHPSAGSTAGFYSNADDGDLNYDMGDIYSAAQKATIEIETHQETGLDWMPSVKGFFRGVGFYDFVGNDANNTQRTRLSHQARLRYSVIDGGVVGAQWLFLDMYLNGTFNVADHAFNVRAGNQVMNWGESIFTGGGINATSAYDVTKLRIPGSELREALVPAPMIHIATDILPDLTLEAYYQIHWNRTNVDPTGSYWATSDLVGRGAEALMFGNDPGGTGLTAQQLMAQGRAIPKISDKTHPYRGQWGTALRYYSKPIFTEFGLYYLRYSSKVPAVGNTAIFLTSPRPQPAPTAYFREYPDDIDTIGASFGSQVLNASFNGEVSYRWADPTAIVATGVALKQAILAGPMIPVSARGYQKAERVQAAVNLIQTFGPATRWFVGHLVELTGADSFSLTSELAVVLYPSLERQCGTSTQPVLDYYLGRSSDCVPWAGPGAPDSQNPYPNPLGATSFAYKSDISPTSWGYQTFLRGEYTNLWGYPITLNPTVAWRHDFYGNTPNGTFVENRKAVSPGIALDYLRTYGASLSYTAFLGDHMKDLVHDRDFVSLSLTYRF
jgi:hypothetical protein